MTLLTMMEQELLISMLRQSVNSANQKIYKQRISFYKAIWKLRDMELVSCTENKINGVTTKTWRLTLDGNIVAKILLKEKGIMKP